MKLLLVLLSFLCLLSSPGRAADRPNIIVILSDDMGFSDLGCYGGVDAKTPNLDSLGMGGLRFTQFYNTARCCPTRAALLTGLYPHQAGVGHMMEDRGQDGYRGNLNQQCVTIAEVLRPAGYRTYMTGKWHVTRDDNANSSKANWPIQRGFDKYYGTIIGAGNFFDPDRLCRQNTLINCRNDAEYQPKQPYYYTDALSDNSVMYMQQHQQESPDKPFFLYVAYTAAHWPMHALDSDIAKYHGKFADGYGPHRAARLERMKQLGLVGHEASLSPQAEDWSKVKNKDWEARCMEVYCAMIDNMDAGIGRIVTQLKASGQYENTLILFLQDNGACAEGVGRTNGDRKGEMFEGQQVKTGPDVMPGPGSTYIAYGRGWANVSNTPFREYKHWVHEGGISTPLIAHWPKGIAADRVGKLEPQPAHLIDLMATFVDVSGAEYPKEHQGQAIKPREGVSLRPAFHGQSLERQQPIFWEHEANRAVRDGKWKLVSKANQPWELYDITVDRIEANNLAAAHPDLVKGLSEKWDAYAERANVLPLYPQGGIAASAGNKTQLRFELTPGMTLEKDQAPAVGRRGFTVSARVNLAKPQANGVIVAQGGSKLGFALFFKDGKPAFSIRNTDGLHEIEGAQALAGTHLITARLSAAGRISLHVDGKVATEEGDCGVIDNQPGEALCVGRDDGAAVGAYRTPNEFKETIETLTIEVEPVAAH